MIDPMWLTLCSYFANALGFDTLLVNWMMRGHFRGYLQVSFGELKKPTIRIFSEIYIH